MKLTLVRNPTDDVREVAGRVPVVAAVHLEARDHRLLTRLELGAAVPGVVIPRDGETVERCYGSRVMRFCGPGGTGSGGGVPSPNVWK